MSLVEKEELRSVAELLEQLPERQLGSFVLMKESGSRHLASSQYPRVITYGSDPRFLLAYGGHPEDANYEVIEMAELDRQSGLWRFRELDFRGGEARLSPDDSSCQACHGNPVRPIWQSFPTWEGAVGEVAGELTQADVDLLGDLASRPHDDPRYARLRFPDPSTLEAGAQFILPTRVFGLTNSVLNIDLSSAVAHGLALRLRQHPDYEQRRLEILKLLFCERQSAVEVFEALGLDSANDLQIGRPIFDTRPDGPVWFTGTTSIQIVVAFTLLVDALEDDPELAEAVADRHDEILQMYENWFELRGEERHEWLTTSYDSNWDGLVPEVAYIPVLNPLCDYLEVAG